MTVVDTMDVSVVVPSFDVVDVVGAIADSEGIFCAMDFVMHSSVELSCVKCVGNSLSIDHRF